MAAYPAFKLENTSFPYLDAVDNPPPVVRLIGNTPLVELKGVTSQLPPSVRVFAKTEWVNPGGSIKDRPSWYMVKEAIERGEMTPSRRILEATSGNTGIALTMIGAALGIGVTVTLPGNVTPERKRLLRAYGAEVIETDASSSTDGAQEKAHEMAQEMPDLYYYTDQFSNRANIRAHYETTGPEIWNQTDGGVTHFISGLGSTGSFMGISSYLKERNPEVRAFSFQPDEPLHGLQGLKHMASVSVPTLFDESLADGNVEVNTDAAYDMMKQLAVKDGLMVGVSAAAAACAALEVASNIESGTVVTLFPDSAYKYMSLPIWD